MFTNFKVAINFIASSEKACLIREAEEAYNACDEEKCIDAIGRLYELFDNNLMNPSFQIAAYLREVSLLN